MNNNSIFQFSQEHTDGDASLTDLLGGKGANLSEMSKMGIKVPPGFTITTEVCNYFMDHEQLPDELEDEINGIALIKCNMVIFTKTSFFTRWEIPQFKIKEDKKKKDETLLSEYSIKDLEEDDISLEEPKDIVPNFQDITLF